MVKHKQKIKTYQTEEPGHLSIWTSTNPIKIVSTVLSSTKCSIVLGSNFKENQHCQNWDTDQVKIVRLCQNLEILSTSWKKWFLICRSCRTARAVEDGLGWLILKKSVRKELRCQYYSLLTNNKPWLEAIKDNTEKISKTYHEKVRVQKPH